MDEKIFNRIEKKYLITKAQQDRLLERIRKYMKEDKYFKSDIHNIYFDTDNYDLIIQSIDHPIFKEKVRARSYGGYDKVFLEIKTKVRGSAYRQDLIADSDVLEDSNIGYKRRVLITRQDFDELVANKSTAETLAAKNIEQGSDIQIAREVDYLLRHFNLKPRIFLRYDRESYSNGDLRVTFDTDLTYRTDNLNFSKNSSDEVFFKTDKNIIMEIKAASAMPLWLAKTLSAEHIYPEQFSKIGKIYECIIADTKHASTLIRKEQNV